MEKPVVNIPAEGSEVIGRDHLLQSVKQSLRMENLPELLVRKRMKL